MISFTDYLREVLVLKRENPNLRMGQCYFNVFSEIDPDHAAFITTLRSIDCFHDDSNIGNFLYEVCATWGLRESHRSR